MGRIVTPLRERLRTFIVFHKQEIFVQGCGGGAVRTLARCTLSTSSESRGEPLQD